MYIYIYIYIDQALVALIPSFWCVLAVDMRSEVCGFVLCRFGFLLMPDVCLLKFFWLLWGRSGVALGHFWVAPGRSGAALGHSWAPLGRSWAHLGCSWLPLGLSWPLLALSWLLLGCSWPLLGRSWGPLGRSWAPPRAIFPSNLSFSKSNEKLKENHRFSPPARSQNEPR